jgi:hypothetical protein
VVPRLRQLIRRRRNPPRSPRQSPCDRVSTVRWPNSYSPPLRVAGFSFSYFRRTKAAGSGGRARSTLASEPALVRVVANNSGKPVSVKKIRICPPIQNEPSCKQQTPRLPAREACDCPTKPPSSMPPILLGLSGAGRWRSSRGECSGTWSASRRADYD